jgi:hypothetical protein
MRERNWIVRNEEVQLLDPPVPLPVLKVFHLRSGEAANCQAGLAESKASACEVGKPSERSVRTKSLLFDRNGAGGRLFARVGSNSGRNKAEQPENNHQ